MNSNIVNSVNVSISKIENDLQNWDIPRESFEKIYQLGNFSLFKRFNIKTCEQTIAINNSLESIKLLIAADIDRYKKDFKFLHIGLVQVAVKPLFRKGLNIPICLLLRDDRLLNFDDSLLGILESNLADGPVYFNCYTNFSVDINDPNIMDTLTLNVKTKNMNSKVDTREIAVIYRVYYKLMKTTIAPKALKVSSKGFTMLMEANQQHSTTFVPRLLKWNDILTDEEWNFQSITNPLPVQTERSHLDHIIQFPDGSVNLKFLRSNSFNQASSSRRMSSSRPSSFFRGETEPSERNSAEETIDKGKIRGVDFSQNIPKVYYEDIGSPTPSDMRPEDPKRSSLGVLTENEFIPDKRILNQWWKLPEHKQKVDWYKATYPLSKRKAFRDKWYLDMKRFKAEVEFFKWFEFSGQIDDTKSSLQVLVNKWHTRNEVVESITPPLEGLRIPYRKDIIVASPFKKNIEKNTSLITADNVNQIIEQNNYTNQILHVVSRKIEDSSKQKVSNQIGNKPSSSKTIEKGETIPIFKVPEFSKENFPDLSKKDDNSSLIERISEQLSKLNVTKGNNLGAIHSDNRFPNKRNYYPKPSFPDVQFEENHLHPYAHADGNGITEWNIDGMAEGQIYNKLQEIGISVTAYKLRGASDKQAAHRVVAGFTGTLKNWWDNYLTEQDKNTIFNATILKTVVKEEEGTSVSTEVPVEDAFATLVYSIAKHFVGEPRLFQDRSLEILNNLHCKRLTDWRWYKNMFINKVMIRQDCNNDYWKERFISGLPPHFAEKVRSKIKDRCEGKIPYSLLSYGDLISVVTIVAMELCTDLKLREQLKNDRS